MNYVSIIMCHYGQADPFGENKAVNMTQTRSELLREVMDSIKNTDYPAELIVIDNGGNPDDSNYLLELTRRGIINTYVRNKQNMFFGWAWNQGAKLAGGDYLCFTCNDIKFEPKWLSTTIKPLLKYPEGKYIATPLITPDKMVEKYNIGSLDGYRLNSFAGSSCMIMSRETYYNIGEMTTHMVAGTVWHRRMHHLGYVVVAPPENLASHLAHKGGLDFYEKANVVKELINKEVIDYTNDGKCRLTISGCDHQKSANHRK